MDGTSHQEVADEASHLSATAQKVAPVIYHITGILEEKGLIEWANDIITGARKDVAEFHVELGTCRAQVLSDTTVMNWGFKKVEFGDQQKLIARNYFDKLKEAGLVQLKEMLKDVQDRILDDEELEDYGEIMSE